MSLIVKTLRLSTRTIFYELIECFSIIEYNIG